jgi:hypothetical protein
MKTLLLCGYRAHDNHELALGVSQSGESLIDQRIQELLQMGHDLICVVGGAEADKQLRHCRNIQLTELVYDTNEPGTLLSNTRSGVFAAPGEACFVLPLEIPPPPPEVWTFLRNEYGKAGFASPHAMLQATLTNGEPVTSHHFGFPLLLTRFGGQLLRETPDLRGLLDDRLKYLRLAI